MRSLPVLQVKKTIPYMEVGDDVDVEFTFKIKDLIYFFFPCFCFLQVASSAASNV